MLSRLEVHSRKTLNIFKFQSLIRRPLTVLHTIYRITYSKVLGAMHPLQSRPAKYATALITNEVTEHVLNYISR